ncbi:MAG: GNAT family N-acetyltransferase [Kiloniellaceae bacterium]
MNQAEQVTGNTAGSAGGIRAARPADASVCERIAHAAYAKYVPRMEKPPSPLFDDYDAILAEGFTHVYELHGEVIAMVTLIPRDGHLLLRNLVVFPDWQGRGIGRRFMTFAEQAAQRHGLAEVHLWTNEAMWENVPYYTALGYAVQGRRVVDGYKRIFMTKRLPPAAQPREGAA